MKQPAGRGVAIFCCLGVTVAHSEEIINPESLRPKGQRYEAVVPDTLDLAERARLSVHGLTSFLNVDANYAPYGHTWLNANPPYMGDMPGGPPNWGKIAESLLLARLMCGSEENLSVDAKTLRGMLSSSWMKINPKAPTPVSRVMLALMAVYQLDPNPKLKELIDTLAERHRQEATYHNEYAYYTDPEPDEKDTSIGVLGHWLPVFIQGCAIRALSRWAVLGEDRASLETVDKLTRFLMQPKFWMPEAGPKAVYGPDHGRFSGHHHAYTQGLMGLLWYAQVTNDARLMEFVRQSYEYMRTFGIARIGLFGEGCTTGDMTFLAIKLSDLGVGDYWEDADQYVRNHLTELQITDSQRLRQVSAVMPPGRGKHDAADGPVGPPNETIENVVERNVGIFLSDGTHPTLIPAHSFLYTICCTGNCTPALYFAWESIVRFENGIAQVNLLLNRASPWLDLDSFLPFEGKVVIRNKKARTISVRIPRWVDKGAVRSRIGDKAVSPMRIGNYLVFDNLSRNDIVTITFPMVESTERYTLLWKQSEFWKESTNPGKTWQPSAKPAQYTCCFRGNTLIDISPRAKGEGYPLYRRDHFRHGSKPPMRKVTRYVSPVIFSW